MTTAFSPLLLFPVLPISTFRASFQGGTGEQGKLLIGRDFILAFPRPPGPLRGS
jgi:hypothetical protein